jgi:predicted ATPase
MNFFKKIIINNWRQFGNVEIDCDNNIVILTGSNGCGKTTILTLLSRHFGWNLNFAATPYMNENKCALYLLPQLPANLRNYINSYILVDSQLYYIQPNETSEKVTINDFSKFLEVLIDLNKNGNQQIHLTDEQTNQLITSNGGHAYKKILGKVYSDFSSVHENNRHTNFDKQIPIGKIDYSDGTTCTIYVDKIESSYYQPRYQNQKNVNGLHIPSHRPITSNAFISTIPTQPKTSAQHFQAYNQLLIQTYGSDSIQNPFKTLKESLISLAIFGYENKVSQGNPEYKTLFEGFNTVLRNILPKTLGFQTLEIRVPDVVLKTTSGEFSLDSMSGGINSLFSLAWQIYMFDDKNKNTVVTIDEPENHLHPSMQRELIPSLKAAFPNVRFIISTHSPFIVTSDPSAFVYGLSYNENKLIDSVKLNSVDLSSSPNKTLKEILDVPIIIPIWVENKIDGVLSKYKNSDNVEAIYNDLKELGLLQELTNYIAAKD